jgi:hypothetical protein
MDEELTSLDGGYTAHLSGPGGLCEFLLQNGFLCGVLHMEKPVPTGGCRVGAI